MLLQVSNVSISFDGKDILKKAGFTLDDKEKCALVGINGAGKTTLLNIISGALEPEEGSALLKTGATFGYLKQEADNDSENTIWDEVISAAKDITDMEEKLKSLENDLSRLNGAELERATDKYTALSEEFNLKGGYALNSEVTGILKGLGFSEDEFDKKVNTLSGGQKTRVALSRLLLTKPDLAILDEPTNHLDVAGIEWLEVFLKNYPGAVLIVSHDRYFLDRVVGKVVELENGMSRVFSGNYSAYAEKKAALRSAEVKAYLNQQAQIKHSQDVIDKLKQFNREKSIKRAESREKQLSKVERLDKPVELNDAMKLKITPSITSGRDVLSVNSLSKAFADNTLFKNISFELIRGERVALIGNNGTGKTTMLKILTGSLNADSGEFTLGTNVHIGYYDQEHAVLNHKNTVFDEISDAYPDMNNTRIRNTLAAFLFTGDDVFKLIGELSGGEQGRVSLAKLMLSRSNFLILDEPTNHLDMISREILEEALCSYEGTVLFVSHDRYFINKCATRIFDLTDKTIIEYKGNYDYYLEKKDELSRRLLGHESDTGKLNSKSGSQGSGTQSSATPTPSGKENWQEMKKRSADERRRENELKRCEEEIANLEKRQSEIDALLSDEETARNSNRLNELSTERAENARRLDKLMEQWETLQS